MERVGETLFSKFDEISGDVKNICLDLKGLRRDIKDIGNEQDRLKLEEIHVLDNEPIGWVNKSLKKFLSNPVVLILFGWFLIKIFVFQEYPALFTSKLRPDTTKTINSVVAVYPDQSHDESKPHYHVPLPSDTGENK